MNNVKEPVLEADALKKEYRSGGSAIEVLKGVELRVDSGEIVSIKGASGSGKSTLLNILAGLDNADSGDVRWLGDSIHPRKVDQRLLAKRRGRFCGFVFQSYYLIHELNALENVLLGRRILGGIRKEDLQYADHLLASLGVDQRKKGLASELSGGERQRVAIARALINRPQLIIADEPTGNLDEQTGEEVISLLLNLCRELNTACLLVTHSPDFANRADRQKTLSRGQLIDG